jgi:hypothetical protein
MGIILSMEQEQIVQNLMANAGFQSVDEVLQVALKLLKQSGNPIRHGWQKRR